MTTTRAVIIGGPEHGRSVRFNGEPPMFLHVARPQSVSFATLTAVPEMEVAFNTISYVLRRFSFGIARPQVWVYVLDGDDLPSTEDVYEAMAAADALERMREGLDERLAWTLEQAYRPAGHMPDTGVSIMVHDNPLGWHKCHGTAQDPHEEVMWEGGPDCWVCGQPGEPCYPPKVKDQAIAPYGWGDES